MPLVLTFYGMGLGLLAAFKAKKITKMCSGLPQPGVKCLLGKLGVGFFKPTTGLSTACDKRKKHLLHRKNDQGKWVFFFILEEIDI